MKNIIKYGNQLCKGGWRGWPVSNIKIANYATGFRNGKKGSIFGTTPPSLYKNVNVLT